MVKNGMLSSILNKVIASLVVIAIVGLFWIERTARSNTAAINVEREKVECVVKKVDAHQEKLSEIGADVKVMMAILERMEKDRDR